MKKMEKGSVRRGFDALDSFVGERQSVMRVIRNCNSCESYYADGEGEDEYCHNPNVTSFDYTEADDGTKFCCYWRLSK